MSFDDFDFCSFEEDEWLDRYEEGYYDGYAAGVSALCKSITEKLNGIKGNIKTGYPTKYDACSSYTKDVADNVINAAFNNSAKNKKGK